jgi:acetyl esterase/lipase
MARLAMRAGAKALKQALRPAKKAAKPKAIKTKVAPRRATVAQPRLKKPATQAKVPARDKPPQWTSGVAVGASGARRYRLYKPPGVKRSERLPLVVMLHGCAQDTQALAASTKMNRLALADVSWCFTRSRMALLTCNTAGTGTTPVQDVHNARLTPLPLPSTMSA